jgi:hypothetical protein
MRSRLLASFDILTARRSSRTRRPQIEMENINQRKNERRLYTAAAFAIVLIVLTGFARTYYLKGVFGTPPLPGLLHFHGVVMTLWVAFFVVQVRLGAIGGLLAGLVVVVGVTTAISAARRGGSPGPPPLVFLAIPLFDMLIFSGFVVAGLFFRRRSDIHKRLMLLSCAGFLTAAVARIPLSFVATGGPLVFFGLTDLFVLAFVAFDTVKHRRLHPVFGWGLPIIIASQPLRLMVAGTQAWMTFANWLVG